MGIFGAPKGTRDEIVKAFKDAKISTSLNYSIVKLLESQLSEHEKILFLQSTYIKTGDSAKKQQSIFIITSENIMHVEGFGGKTTFGKYRKSELKEYQIERSGTLKLPIIKFVFQHNYLEVYLSTSAFGDKITSALEPATGERPEYGNQKNIKNGDAIEQIKRLSELFDQGIITKTEFEEKKLELLNRI